MAHEPPTMLIERWDRDRHVWYPVEHGLHWTWRQAFLHLETLRGRGWRVRVSGKALELDLQPGDDWEGKPWA